LEPVAIADVEDVWTLAASVSGAGAPEAAGAPFVTDPAAALRSPDVNRQEVETETLRLIAALQHGAAVFDGGWNPESTPVTCVSRRQFAQALIYASWFELLSFASGNKDVNQNCRIGAENAVLHHILPTLSPNDFERALGNYAEKDNLTSSAPGGLLANRIARLREGLDESVLIGRVLDFWDRLS